MQQLLVFAPAVAQLLSRGGDVIRVRAGNPIRRGMTRRKEEESERAPREMMKSVREEGVCGMDVHGYMPLGGGCIVTAVYAFGVSADEKWFGVRAERMLCMIVE